jgi:hypothetical protein
MDHIDCYCMNIVLCISFAVCICPGIRKSPSQQLIRFNRTCWIKVTPQLSLLQVEPVIQYLHTVNHIRCRRYCREWIILDCYCMNIVLCISFAVCICPCVCISPSQIPSCFNRTCWSKVTPQLSVTTGGAVIQYLHNSQPHPLSEYRRNGSYSIVTV